MHALAAESSGHGDPVAPVVGMLTFILVGAKLGGEAASRLGQPAVLGELLVGILIGNLDLLGFDRLDWVAADPSIDMLARLGVLILLFEVGLESTVRRMLETGAVSATVAILGVAAPFALGWMIPQSGRYGHAFLGATLSATSIGITTRVLKDLGRSQSREARVILGAAVIDDVLGLVILALLTGLIGAADRGAPASYGEMAVIGGKAIGFLALSIALGVRFAPRVFRAGAKLIAGGVLLTLGLSFCFLFAWLADRIGLAPIVGAFAAGLVLEEIHYRDFVDRGEHGLADLVRPISSFLVPIFFVLMGMRTDLREFAAPGVPTLATALTAAAIIGKLVCALGVFGPPMNRLAVGIGMIPRGEVGLIFASIGSQLSLGGTPVISRSVFSALVVMVTFTTMLTPPLLKWSLRQKASVR
jgi:Kef-type K+ transport system membrane component KefB